MTPKFTGEKPCAHMNVDAWIVEVRFLNAMSSERRQVRAVDLHQADVVSARALAMRVVDGSWVETRFHPGHRIEQLRRHAVALTRLFPARNCEIGCERQREDGSRSNTSHGSLHSAN